MPMDVMPDGELEAVFERIAQDWGKLDFLVHSIAFSTKDALGGRVTDVPRARLRRPRWTSRSGPSCAWPISPSR